MGRMTKPYCLKKKGDYWYYKLPSMTTYKSTFLTSKTKSEKYVLDLLEELNKKNGVVGETEKTFGEYTKDYFIWGKCPYFKRRIEYEGRNLTQRYCEECFKTLDKKIRPISWFMKKKIKDIKRKDIILLIEDLKKKNSNGVVNDCITILRLIFNDCIYREDIENNPMSCIKKLVEKKSEKVPFTMEDYPCKSCPSIFWRTNPIS